MSLSLGEKLRQAREEKGISIGEVSEQTRISPLYIECIENDDYKPLPGGIFNKGFVKSYAKFIGIDEHEALQDYSRIVAQTEGAGEEIKKYKPEVLTDDRAAASMVPTIIFAGIILALMTGGVLFLVNYLQNQSDSPNNEPSRTANANSANQPANANMSTQPSSVPSMDSLKVEFSSVSEAVSLSSVTDGRKASTTVDTVTPAVFEPKDSLKLSYSRSLAASAKLTINGRAITLPATPANPRRAAIEFEINKDNIAKIWQTGAITFDEPAGEVTTAPSVTPTATAAPVRPAASPTATAAPTRTPVPVRPATPAPRPNGTATPSADIR